MTLPAEFSIVIPNFAAGDAMRFAVLVGLLVLLPGHALGRLLRIRPGNLWERWALTAVLGILWASLLYFFLAALGWERFQVALVPLPVLVEVAGAWRRLRRRGRMGTSRPVAPVRRRPLVGVLSGHKLAQFTGLLLVAAFTSGYLFRTAALVQPDATGLRLYGAFYSDKMTNMSPCAALIHGVPPAALRISGYTFPSHYFPHLLVAWLHTLSGVDYVDLFWFHVAALGVAVRSLAVLGFARRVLRSPWLACGALALFGLARFSPQGKTLDLSLALLLLAITALDRYRAAGRRRWAVLAVGLVAAMPFYEVFTAAAALAGLVVWAALGAWGRPSEERRAGADLSERPKGCFAEMRHAPFFRRSRKRLWRAAIAAATILGAAGATRMLYLGAELVSPPQFVVKNCYRDSYKHEWNDRLRQPDPPRWMATIYAWKRGKPVAKVAPTLPGAGRARPGLPRHLLGEVVFDVGYAGYFLLRFVNLGLFGVIALVAVRRGGRWTSTQALIGSLALVGFGLPACLSWGHMAEGQWWETPNIYRFTTCGRLLLLLVGTGMLFRAVGQWRRRRWWLPLALAAGSVWGLAAGYFRPATSFHHVSRDRLGALAYLRENVPFGQVVLHPWVDDLIRRRERPGEVAWVYKRHFTLASNLAGCQMYYEGRADHLFINGFVAAEEVYRRRRLRDRFYRSPDAEVVGRMVGEGRVRWVVADAEHPAPKEIAQTWALAYANQTVRIYTRRRE